MHNVIHQHFMIRQEEIALVVNSQRDTFLKQDLGFTRAALRDIPTADSFATIISGMRRCGKSTLLMQLLHKDVGNTLFLNFDDIRLSGFETGDLARLHREVERQQVKVLYFDEIQIIKGWEKYIHQVLREGYKVYITGSNASMLSIELGTHLTGRHLSMELFPFSYMEFITFRELKNGKDAVLTYLKTGGIPEYIKTGISTVLNTLVDDILIRDVAVRHSLRDVTSLRRVTTYLITNIGNLISANKLVGMFDIKSPSTFLEYFSFLKDAYVLDFVTMFSHSLKVQARNPRKVYVMDMGLYTENAVCTSDNMGKRFENLIFLHLRRKYNHIFYYKNRGECDFIILEKNVVTQAIQVCLAVNDENFDREYKGLSEAMKELGLREGTIVTLDQRDRYEKDGLVITMIPVYEFIADFQDNRN